MHAACPVILGAIRNAERELIINGRADGCSRLKQQLLQHILIERIAQVIIAELHIEFGDLIQIEEFKRRLCVIAAALDLALELLDGVVLFVDHGIQTGILPRDKILVVDRAEARGHLHHTHVGERLVLIPGSGIAENDRVFICTFVQVALNRCKAVFPASFCCGFCGLSLIDTHLADILRLGFFRPCEEAEHLKVRQKADRQGKYNGKGRKEQLTRFLRQLVDHFSCPPFCVF